MPQIQFLPHHLKPNFKRKNEWFNDDECRLRAATSQEKCRELSGPKDIHPHLWPPATSPICRAHLQCSLGGKGLLLFSFLKPCSTYKMDRKSLQTISWATETLRIAPQTQLPIPPKLTKWSAPDRNKRTSSPKGASLGTSRECLWWGHWEWDTKLPFYSLESWPRAASPAPKVCMLCLFSPRLILEMLLKQHKQ